MDRVEREISNAGNQNNNAAGEDNSGDNFGTDDIKDSARSETEAGKDSTGANGQNTDRSEAKGGQDTDRSQTKQGQDDANDNSDEKDTENVTDDSQKPSGEDEVDGKGKTTGVTYRKGERTEQDADGEVRTGNDNTITENESPKAGDETS